MSVVFPGIVSNPTWETRLQMHKKQGWNPRTRSREIPQPLYRAADILCKPPKLTHVYRFIKYLLLGGSMFYPSTHVVVTFSLSAHVSQAVAMERDRAVRALLPCKDLQVHEWSNSKDSTRLRFLQGGTALPSIRD